MQGRILVKRTAAVFAVAWCFVASAPAATLVSNTGQTLNSGTNFGNTSYRYATDFTTNGLGSTITAATAEVANLDTGTAHTFTMTIVTDNGGTPQGGTVVGTFNAFSAPLNTGPAIYSTVATSSFALAANTIYWEVLRMNEAPVSSTAQDDYTSSESVDAGSLFSFIPATALKFSTDGGTTYSDVTAFSSPIHGNFQFSLTGTQSVPEPSRALLSVASLGAVMLRRRRK